MVICYQGPPGNIKHGGALEIEIKINPPAQEISSLNLQDVLQ